MFEVILWLSPFAFLSSVVHSCSPQPQKLYGFIPPEGYPMRGKVIKDITLEGGRVTFRGSDWIARALQGELIPKDSVVQIVRQEGTTLIVKLLSLPAQNDR
ncbi:MAG: NfeD family protein [Cyanophyceae cyanobacterium]